MAHVITRAQWKAFAPKCPANYTDALFNNLGLLANAGILDNELRICHFFATCYAEMDGGSNFREIREDLNYKTPKALRTAWPSRFNALSDAELAPYLRNEKRLGSKVYGPESGRAHKMGNTEPNDGFDFRGGGWFNTTGRGAVEAYLKKLGLPTPADPGVLDDPELTLKFAVYEWTETNCNRWADENEIVKVAKAVNTGSASSNIRPNGMDNREEGFAKAWKIWGESGEADMPLSTGGPSLTKVLTRVVLPSMAGGKIVNDAAGGVDVVAPVINSLPNAASLPDATTIGSYLGLVEQLKPLIDMLQPLLPVLPWVGGVVVVYILINYISKK